MRYLVVIALVYVTCVAAEELEKIPYDGLRLDLSALTLNRDILGTIIPALKLTLDAVFPDLQESGSFGASMHVTNIKIKGYNINEERFDMNKYEFVAPTYKLKGGFEAIYFAIAFDYAKKWLGITVDSGSASAYVTNVNSEILVFFNESEPDVQIPHPWEVKNLTMSSWFPETDWVQSMLHTHFVPVFHAAVDKSMDDFAHNLLRTYTYFEDVFPRDIDLVFRSRLVRVQSSMKGSYFSLAFRTNITVNKNLHRYVSRKINGTIAPLGDFEYCLPAEMIPDVLDVVGKAGYYNAEIEPEKWGFASNNIKELYNIVPSLEKKYAPTTEFGISCSKGLLDGVLDLTQRDLQEPYLELQDPNLCFIYIKSNGDYVLLLDVFMRYAYEMICRVDASYYGHIRVSQLYDFRSTPLLPVAKHAIMEQHLKNFSEMYQESALLSPGIKVLPNRNSEVKFVSAHIQAEEICMFYKETRPI